MLIDVKWCKGKPQRLRYRALPSVHRFPLAQVLAPTCGEPCNDGKTQTDIFLRYFSY